MKAAIYARFSTEKQSAASIDDQIRVCERLAERHGFDIVERFSDAGISGGTADRPGYQQMLAAARRHEFDVIVAEDTSRLWRNLAEQAPRLAELADLDIHVVTHDLDTRNEGAGMLAAVLGESANAYRKEIGRRTKRGLEGVARNRKSTGGRAYAYLSAKDSASGQREIHAEQAETVVRIFTWYADGKSPRWIAKELNRLGIPSPGASWNRKDNGLNAKRKRGWVDTAIHGDRRRGTGILNNPLYVGQVVWGRTVWKRAHADSKLRRSELSAEPVVKYSDERLRIVPQELWERVKARQKSIDQTTVTLRSALKRNGRMPRHLLSGLMQCATCGGSYAIVNAREFGCTTHKAGSDCDNDVRVKIEVAERHLLEVIRQEILSPEGIAKAEKLYRDQVKLAAKKEHQRPATGQPAARLARKQTEIAQLRALMKAGTLSEAVAQVAINQAEGELSTLQAPPKVDERETARVVRMLPRVAEALRERVALPNLGLEDPRSILQGRNALFGMFGGKVPLRPKRDAERPYLVARVGINRAVLLDGCRLTGSGGRI